MSKAELQEIDCSKMQDGKDCLKNKCDYAFTLEGDFFHSKPKSSGANELSVANEE